jgi:zinc/manganese transport system substrate-binding protein
MRSVFRLAMVFLLALALGACRPPSGEVASPAPQDAPLQVIASFSILGDIVQNVGGEDVVVATLVSAGADTHTFDPSPRDAATLAGARLVFEIGLEFEPWLDRLFAASGSQAGRIVVTHGLALRSAASDEHNSDGGHDGHPDDDDHGEYDPHVWHDVANVIHMVEVIRDALARADPPNGASYEANAAAYMSELRDLDRWVRDQVQMLPPERRKLVTNHDTFAYFAAAYGFEITGTAMGAVTTEVADPSARQIAMLVEEIRAAGVPAVFAENVSNTHLMAQIAQEAGVSLGPPLYSDALGPPGSESDTFIRLMRHNVGAIVNALASD